MTASYELDVLPERMRRKIAIDGTCWMWLGARNQKGYGSTSAGRRNKSMLAHRAAYAAVNGAIPDGLEIDHLCENPPCVNPAHLDAVTPEEHRRRIGHVDLAPVYAPEPTRSSGLESVFTDFLARIEESRRRYDAMSPEQRAEHDARRHRLHVLSNSRCQCEVPTG